MVKFISSLLALAASAYAAEDYSYLNNIYQNTAPAQAAAPMGGMNPMMLMALMGDSDIDPLMLMMMSGGMGGQGGAGLGGMDPMMMYFLMKDSDSSSSSSDLLPLLMMNGGLGGAGGAAGGMNPMMLMMLMEDDCELDSDIGGSISEDDKKAIAKGEKFYIGTDAANAVDADVVDYATIATQTLSDAQATITLSHLDYEYKHCVEKSGSSDLLPLMMMGGDQGLGGAGGMNPMMMMALLGDSNIDPLMMMMMGGQGMGGMNPMMMMLMLDGDKSVSQCNDKYDLEDAFVVSGAVDSRVITRITEDFEDVFDSANAIAALSYPDSSVDFVEDFADCLEDADDDDDSSSFKDLLPLLMMNQQNGGAPLF